MAPRVFRDPKLHLKIIMLSWMISLTSATGRPKIQPFSFPSEVILGKTISVMCTAMEGKAPLSFKWLKDNKELASDGEVTQTVLEKVSVLLLPQVKSQSRGNYSCVVSNEVGQDVYTAVLSVKAPPEWLQEPRDLDAVLGSIVVLNCSADGLPVPTIKWKRLNDGGDRIIGGLVSDNSRWAVWMNGSVTIDSVAASDGGSYECEAENGVGNALRKTITLSVRGKDLNIFPLPMVTNISGKFEIYYRHTFILLR